MLKIPDDNAEVQGVVQEVTAGTTNSFNLETGFGWE